MKKGFTLIEMLVVIGIIAVLTAGMIGAYAHVTKAAEKARCQELVHATATALTAMFQQEGVWPKSLRTEGATDGILDEQVAYALARGGYMSLTTSNNKLSGYDRFGLVTPWATTVIKQRGNRASLSDPVPGGGKIQDHRLHFAIDLDGDGVIDGANVGGQTVPIRATAAVWCCGKDGKLEAYSIGLRRDDVYSWTHGQTQQVK